MKKTIFISVAILLSLLSAHGQDGQSLRKFDLSYGIGGPSALSRNDIGHGLWSMAVEIRYTPVKWVSIGVMGGIHDWRKQNMASSYWDPSDDARERVIKGNAMLLVYGNWYTGEKLKVYSGIGIGTKNKEIENNVPVGLEFVPVGLAFGKRFYGFLECCFGTMAFPGRLGIGYRF